MAPPIPCVASECFSTVYTAISYEPSTDRHVILQMNMYALDSMAGMERNLGTGLFAIFYLLSGLGGSVASFLFSPVPSLGASGCVFGMFSATWMYFENNKPYLSRGAKAAQQSIFQTMMINLLLGTFIARVDNWCAFFSRAMAP